jgi:glutamyl/glutaminyl-tRNA synthetase
MINQKVVVKIVNEHDEKYAEIRISDEQLIYSEIRHFTLEEIITMLEKLGVSVEYKDVYQHDNTFCIFNEYKEYIERLVKEKGETFKQFFTHKDLRACKMLDEIINTETNEAYSAERGLEIVQNKNLFDPGWYYQGLMTTDRIDRNRWQQIYDTIELKIKTELDLV